MMTPRYYAPDGRPAAADRAHHRPRASSPRRMPCCRAGRCATSSPAALPFWEQTRLWVIARPLSGFAETFSQYIVEVAPGGGSDRPEPDPGAEAVLFVVDGGADADHRRRDRTSWARAATPSSRRARDWTLRNTGDAPATFHWIRKAYERVDGIDVPRAVRHQRARRRRPARCPAPTARWTHAAVRRPARRAPRHARQHRQLRAGRGDPVPRDARHGARALRARGQGRLPAQQGLGRGAGGRLHVAAGVLPPGLLRRRARAGSATCSTRTSTGTRSSGGSSSRPLGRQPIPRSDPFQHCAEAPRFDRQRRCCSHG